jgi:hypothetical protein
VCFLIELQAFGFIFLDPSLMVPSEFTEQSICVFCLLFLCGREALFMIVKMLILLFSYRRSLFLSVGDFLVFSVEL